MSQELVQILSICIAAGSLAATCASALVAIGALIALGKQTREARLASSMDATLALYTEWVRIQPFRQEIGEIVTQATWSNLSPADKVSSLEASPATHLAWSQIASFFEVLGVLVSEGALPENLVLATFGDPLDNWWASLEPAISHVESRPGNEHAFDNLRWLIGRRRPRAQTNP